MKKFLLWVLILLTICGSSAVILISKQDKAQAVNGKPLTPAYAHPVAAPAKVVPEYSIVGYSSRGNVIQAVTIAPPKYNKTILLTFAMHGFDDSWDYDGAALVQIANDVISSFASNPADLNRTRMIIVPCVNPDGLLRSLNDNVAGRRNGLGIDINRDFDYQWTYCGEAQYHTGVKPFSTPEANILKDLVLKEHPDLVIDFHGWMNAVYGDEQIGQYFSDSLAVANHGLNVVADAALSKTFIGWAQQHTRAILVEYPDPKNPVNVINLKYSQKTISVIKQICQEI
jgi:murein tripeptide amidase MpaA